MPDEAEDRAPTWIFIMRHVKARRAGHPASARPDEEAKTPVDPAVVLDETGLEEAGQVGSHLAWTLDDLARGEGPVHIARVVHDHSTVAEATAAAVATAYEEVADALHAEHRSRPAPLGGREPWSRGLSGQATEEQEECWLKLTAARLTGGPPPRQGQQETAVLLVGHEPGMSRLVTHLLQANRRFRRPDVPALARGELLALRRQRERWLPVWALTPRTGDDPAAKDIEAITAKVKSKMDTAKVFGVALTALLTFVAGQFAAVSTPPSPAPPDTGVWAIMRGLSLAALGVAAVLYFMTLFWYDRLLMPVRFWSSERARRREDAAAVVLRRPPSSAVWVLYQNMQRTWRLLFVPAVYATGLGIAAFAVARIKPSGAETVVLVAAALVVALGGWWGWRARPVLGVQD